MTDDPILLLRRFILSVCVWREARGESQRGKRLVAQVIRNRVEDKRWPDTYSGVITQPFQFSSFNANDPNSSKFPSETDESWIGCVAAADAVLESDEPFTTANHYKTLTAVAAWADPSKIVATEMNHVFYCL